MAKQYGENIATNVQQGRVRINSTGWTLLTANGTSNLPGRTHIRIQTRGVIGHAIGLAYANGTTTDAVTYSFTTPTSSPQDATVFRGTATWVEPVGDKVQIFGRLILKAGVTGINSLNVVITEYR